MSDTELDSLKEYLEAFSTSTDIPVSLYDPEGGMLADYLPERKFCQFFPHYRRRGSECWDNLLFSAQLSYEMGEPYIYYCPVGLVHIAVPVILGGKFTACAVAGPLIMGEADERLLDKAMTLDAGAAAQLSRIALFTAQMRRFPPTQIQRLSVLLGAAVLHSQQNYGDYALASARHRQQLAMGEHIRARKLAASSRSASPSCQELEDTFVQRLRERDAQGALACLDQLIDELILVEGGNFDSVKMHMLELYLSLTRMALDSGVPLRKVLGGNLALLSSLSAVEDVETLCDWARRSAESFSTEVFAGLSPLSSATAKAVAYLGEHYMEKITLRELAARLFVSDSYLSKLFRQELGTSFTDYLNRSRVERSIELMQSTELSLLEIAGQVGFEDQSYFTKVFKRIIGETPRQHKNRFVGGRGNGT